MAFSEGTIFLPLERGVFFVSSGGLGSFLASSAYFPRPAGGPCDRFVPVESSENGNPLAALILYVLEADRHVTLQGAMKGVACGILHAAERLDTLVSPAGFCSFRSFYSALIHNPLEVRVKGLLQKSQ